MKIRHFCHVAPLLVLVAGDETRPHESKRPSFLSVESDVFSDTNLDVSAHFGTFKGEKVHEFRTARNASVNKSNDGIEPRLYPRSRPATWPTVSNDKAQMAFRPVSVTLYVVMALTIVCLALYTVLAFFRNRDELAGMQEQSLVTDVLEAASRSTAYCPMVCMTCVACRMFILANTNGLGEPPAWIKACMIASAVGCVFQFIVVVMLPATVDTSTLEKQKTPFVDHVGDQFDTHPRIDKPKFIYESLKTTLWILQILCVVLIYGGIFGVIFGTFFLSSSGSVPVSSSVLCTLLLSALFFTVSLGTWVSRVTAGDELAPAVKGFVAASMVARKAPMLAVLFLSARMRAINLDPPNGMPPPWAQAVYMVTTAALALETVGAFVVGATGEEKTGYYKAKRYKSSKLYSIVQHLAAMVAIVGAICTFCSIILLEGTSAGGPTALSPAVRCVLELNGVFFFVMAMLTVTAFLDDIFDQNLQILENLFNAASVALSFAPLLCILFIATRMRALQITHQQGNPPSWTQDCFYLCSFATSLQVACCLALPVFLGAAEVQVHKDGSPMYELKPMVGAYAVTVVKFVCLLSLYGGIVAICISVFTMTPQTARPGISAFQNSREVFEMVFILILIFLIAMVLSSAKAVGLAIKFAIESVDKQFLGVDIHVGAAALSICRGLVMVSGLHVDNPEGYHTPYLLKLDSLVVKLNIGRLICTFGKEFEVTWLELNGVQLIFEKDFCHHGCESNVNKLMDNLKHKDEEQNSPPEADKKPVQNEADKKPAQNDTEKPVDNVKTIEPQDKKDKKDEEHKGPHVFVYRVNVKDIGVAIYNCEKKAASWGIGPMDIENLWERCGGETQSTKKLVRVILGLILETVRTNEGLTKKLVLLGAEILKEKAKEAGKELGHAAVEGMHHLSDKILHHGHQPTSPPSSGSSRFRWWGHSSDKSPPKSPTTPATPMTTGTPK